MKKETKPGVGSAGAEKEDRKRDPSKFPEAEPDAGDNDSGAGEPPDRTRSLRYWPPESPFEFWQIILNTLLVAATAGLVFYSCEELGALKTQLEELRRQGEQTERALVITQRARIVVAGAQIKGPFEGGKQPDFKVRLDNEGVGPALSVRTQIFFALRDDGMPDLSLRAECRDGGSTTVIGPRSTHASEPIKRPSTLYGWQADAIAKGVLVPYVFGHVTYNDDFTDHRISTFCFWWDPEAEKFMGCPYGNSAP